jgi:AraC-like DNA-binding protein/ligand-binding sensor protein
LLVIGLEAVDNPSSTLEKLSDLFRSVTGLDVRLVYHSEDSGKENTRTLGAKTRMRSFCRLLQDVPEGRRRCRASHKTLTNRGMEERGFVHGRCHAGLLISCFPVVVRGQGLGGIQTACVLVDKPGEQELADLLERIADLRVPKKKALGAARSLGSVSGVDIERIGKWLGLFADYLVESSSAEPPEGRDETAGYEASPYIGLGSRVEERFRHAIGQFVTLPPPRANRSCGCSSALIDRVYAFLDTHSSLPLSGKVMASALGFEASYFVKMCKRHKKTSPSKRLRRLRVEQAKVLLRNPYLSIQEVADRTGFADASYFARVFREETKATPSLYRKRMAGKP